jgi:beta-lactamase regulating signal transducer with metallopeptidase domain/HEAT repeat protein
MNELIQWGGHPVVQRLGWTLVHFLWQGAVIAGLFALAHIGQAKRSSNARYWIGCLGLLLMMAAPIFTYFALGLDRPPAVALSASQPQLEDNSFKAPAGSTVPIPFVPEGSDNSHRAAVSNPHPDLNLPPSTTLHSEEFIRIFVLAWFVGVSVLSLRLLFCSLQVARLKRQNNEPLGEPWITRLHRLKAALQISRPVRLVKSVLVEVPTVVGWLRPVILLPAASLMGLTAGQLESILAHELAHIRHHDYLVNLLQNVLETLLFYHPAVWWISSCVRAEREICCDEIAVRLCGDRLVYAQALTTLEELRGGQTTLALGANGGSLLERIRRLSGAPANGRFPSRRSAGGALVGALVTIIFLALLHQPSNNAQAQATSAAARRQINASAGAVIAQKTDGIPSGLSLVIRCTNDVLKVGDEIPIEFILSNHGSEEYTYVGDAPFIGMEEFELAARMASGEIVADPGSHFVWHEGGGAEIHLLPGESLTKIIFLNRWALIKEAGRFEVTGTYHTDPRPLSFSSTPTNMGSLVANPISITVLPRSKEDMADYVKSLTNQIAARLAALPHTEKELDEQVKGKNDWNGVRVTTQTRVIWVGQHAVPLEETKKKVLRDGVLHELVRKAGYTCNPEIVPTLLSFMSSTSSPAAANETHWAEEALAIYIPHTEATLSAILQGAVVIGLNFEMDQLLMDCPFKNVEMKPLIERALAADNTAQWPDGAKLASRYYDDAFTVRLIEIAMSNNSQLDARYEAISALAYNRTDAGVKALKTLRNHDPDQQISEIVRSAIKNALYGLGSDQPGKRLRPDDFDAKFSDPEGSLEEPPGKAEFPEAPPAAIKQTSAETNTAPNPPQALNGTVLLSQEEHRIDGQASENAKGQAGDIVREPRLSEGAFLKGRLLKEGKPVANADIRIAGVNPLSFPREYSAATDSDGRFSFEHIPMHRDYYLYGTMRSLKDRGALSIRRVWTGENGSTNDLGALNLEPAYIVEGRVNMTDGKPVPADCSFTLSRAVVTPQTGGNRYSLWQEASFDHTTVQVGKDGHFHFSGVPGETVFMDFMLPLPYQVSRRNASAESGSRSHLLGRVVKDITDLMIDIDSVMTEEKTPPVDLQSLSQRPLRGVEAGPISRLRNGTELSLLAVTHGPPNTFLPDGQQDNPINDDWRKLDGTLEFSNKLVLWIGQRGPSGAPPLPVPEGDQWFSDLRATLADEKGEEWDTRVTLSYPFQHENLREWNWVFPLDFSSFPRRGETLRFKFYVRNDSDAWDTLADFTFPNPVPGPYPIWKPANLPVLQTNGDLQVSLISLTTGAKPLAYHFGIRPFTRATFNVKVNGQPTDAWGPDHIEVTDATGNEPWWPAANSGTTNGLSYYEIDGVGLSPSEVWRVRARFARSGTPLWTSPELPVRTGSLLPMSLRTNVQSLPITLACKQSPFHNTIVLKAADLPANAKLGPSQILDDQGRPAKYESGGFSDSGFDAQWEIPVGAKWLKVSITLSETRTFDFLAKPTSAKFKEPEGTSEQPAGKAKDAETPTGATNHTSAETNSAPNLPQASNGTVFHPQEEHRIQEQPSGNVIAAETSSTAPNQINASPASVNSSKPAANPPGLSLVIRCTNDVLKVGDEIPIEFIVSNHGTEDYQYQDPPSDASDRLAQFELIAKTASGSHVPVPGSLGRVPRYGSVYTPRVLHPGESFTKVISLNRWALVKQPGQYDVVGTYVRNPYSRKRSVPVSADPIRVIVLPRTKEELDDYIKGLTNQVATRLALHAGKKGGPPDPVLDELLLRLMYTCSPEIVPTMLTVACEVGTETGTNPYESNVETGSVGSLVLEALFSYAPNRKATKQSILQAAAIHGVNGNMCELLVNSGANDEELKPLIERALAPQNSVEWQSGAALANLHYDDAFTTRLIAIASSADTQVKARTEAIRALVWNRSDAGVKTLKTLLKVSDPQIWRSLASDFVGAPPLPFKPMHHPRGARPSLRGSNARDFDATDMRPLIEWLLASTNSFDWGLGVKLAARFGEDSLTPKLVTLATNPGFADRDIAIYALALNRTDEGVQTLKTLLNDPDEKTRAMTEEFIRYAYKWGGDTPGKPLRADDFDAKFRKPKQQKTEGLKIVALLGDDASVPRMVKWATDPEFTDREGAMYALAMNRTDEGVKTLKTLLHDSDPEISAMAERSIRRAYTSRGEAKGRPLRPDDFDAKFREPEGPLEQSAGKAKDPETPQTNPPRELNGTP